MRFLILAFSLPAFASSPASADEPIPGQAQKRPVALVGGTVHPVSAAPIPGGTVLFDKGRIVAVGQAVELPPRTERIDVTGRHVYPGLFEAHSQLGLIEIASVRATLDYRESGSINPNVQAQLAVNPESTLIPVTRSNGVLLALTAPSGGIVSGRAAVLQLDGWTYEDLTLKPAAALMVNWPRMTPLFRATGDEPVEEQNRERDDALAGLRTLFDDARAWNRSRRTEPVRQAWDIRMQAMQPVLAGEIPLLVRADELAAIQSAVRFCADQNVRMILLGGYDAALCAPLLKAHNVPVIVSAIHRRPRRRSEAYDTPYTLPARLHKAGLRFCISGTDRSETTNARNLPYEAGMAVAWGLPAAEALRSITLSPAEIFGVAERVGSLEPGKDATLIVTSGDPLETTTQVERAWIQGRTVDLSDKHKRLYNKYRERYRRLGNAGSR